MDDPDLMKRFVGSVNMELVKLVNEGELVPISLKAQTSKVTMKAKSTNIQPIPGGDLGEVRGWFTEKPYCYCNVVTGKKGKDEIDAHPDQVEYLKSKGWTEAKPKSVNKNKKNSAE